MTLTKQIWALMDKVEQLRADAENCRKATSDFNEKNLIAAREVAYEQVLYLLRNSDKCFTQENS